MGHPARFWHLTDDDRVQCDLCPHDCRLGDGQHGLCLGRERLGDALVSTTYGRSSGFAVDPIEKKPLYHFFPGSPVLSFGTAGCNLACRFCQNWGISRARDTDRLAAHATPDAIARAARSHGCTSVAFTYNDPVVFLEYAMDTADACHALGIQTVAVTAGYMHAEPRRALYEKIDAANVDLKAFTEDFYARQTGSHLAPVKETLEYLVKETHVWTEVTTLLIPGLNDSEREVAELSAWVASALGPDVPLHFSAFHPDHRMTDRPPTPPATLRAARDVAVREGLRHVYTGNVRDSVGATTFCASCRTSVIVRDGFDIASSSLHHGRCGTCNAPLPGRFGDEVGDHGGRCLRATVE
jgi:pyruvate formate lyase activating enzyme